MTAWLAIVAAVGLIVGILGGPPYVVAVMLGAFVWPALWILVDRLAQWRRRRIVRRTVYRRWAAWSLADLARRYRQGRR